MTNGCDPTFSLPLADWKEGVRHVKSLNMNTHRPLGMIQGSCGV